MTTFEILYTVQFIAVLFLGITIGLTYAVFRMRGG